MTTTARAPAETGLLATAVLDEVERVVVGKRGALELILLGVLAGGHVLIEDLPGLGKTLMARSLTQVLGLDFTRIQFTPDLLPGDVTGMSVYDRRSGEMVFRPGPVFTHLLLADEINRTPPKTQSALLEAMAEGQVSVDGVTRGLPQPFVVLATDNPIEYEGTYPLPEAQLDRFLERVSIGYLSAADEARVLRQHRSDGTRPELRRLCKPADVLAMRASLDFVQVIDDLVGYIVALVDATRHHPKVVVGASPRGAIAVQQLAKAHAVLAGRDFALPEDVKAVAVPALAHRLALRPEMWVRRITGEDVITELLAQVPTPPTRQ
ncbi:MAG: AAA family ATPase [Pseudonocardiaceae bacterium]